MKKIDVVYVPQEDVFQPLLDNGGIFRELDGITIKVYWAPF